jgi:FkbM family methyltransferase
VILPIKRFLFRLVPSLGLELAKLTSRPRGIELDIVQAVVPHDRLAIDIGASWGLYTYLLRRCTSAVVAFEPNPEKAEYLRCLFRDSAVVVHQVALSDSSGEAELIVPLATSAFATIETKNPLWTATDVDAARIHVPRQTLTDFEFPQVGFMKIDVEGHEYAVLSGARELLLRDKPILYIRIERRHNPKEYERTFELLAHMGYSGFSSDGRRLVDVRTFEIERDQPPENVEGNRIKGRYIYNFLFLQPTDIDTSLAALSRAGFDVPL